MKHLRVLAAILFCFLLYTTFAVADTHIMVVSDTHLMGPELYEGSDLMDRSIAGGDGKVSHLSRELADGLVAEATHQMPDVLLVTGDLTHGGEYRSHLFVAQTLRRVMDLGIPVCVIPGNHDICSWNAYDYSGEKAKPVNGIEPRNYANIYADMRPGEAAPDGCGFSYVYKVNDSVWLLMLDTCYYDPEEGQAAGGYIRDGLLPWISGVIEDAKASGAQVISATHQGLYPHSSFKSNMYMVYGGDQVASMMVNAGMKLNLSGHVHAQHILQKDGLWDAAIGAFSLSPHLYAMVDVSDSGAIHYEAKPTCAEHFPDGFTDVTRGRFLESVRLHQTAPNEMTADEIQAALILRDRVNYAYFSGQMGAMADLRETDPTWAMLNSKYPESTVFEAVERLLNETTSDMRVLDIP